jgi:deoxyribonuclease-4
MSKRTSADQLLIGAHTSASGGVHCALLEGREIGATTVQLFTSNQKRWVGKPIDEEEVRRWQDALQETGLTSIMSHDSYLINLGSPDPDILAKSRAAFREELIRCQQLGLAFLNFHPGAATSASEEECLDTIVTSLKGLEKLAAKGSTRLLIETTAGQGTCVGHQFEQLGYLVDRVKRVIPIGVCIDTCHIFAAGYDIRSQEGWDRTLDAFDAAIGLEHLYALHVNDSMKPLGSRKDRHAPLGEGEIGLDCFRVLMTDPRLRALPKYLETPDGPPLWKKEIQLLREFAR